MIADLALVCEALSSLDDGSVVSRAGDTRVNDGLSTGGVLSPASHLHL